MLSKHTQVAESLPVITMSSCIFMTKAKIGNVHNLNSFTSCELIVTSRLFEELNEIKLLIFKGCWKGEINIGPSQNHIQQIIHTCAKYNKKAYKINTEENY